MAKTIKAKMPKSESEYRELKARCNLYERTWRKKHPKEHKKNSQQLIKAIMEPQKLPPKTEPKRKATKAGFIKHLQKQHKKSEPQDVILPPTQP